MSGPCQVLIVADDEELRRTAGRVLELAGFACSSAAGAEAVERLTETPADLLVVDLEATGERPAVWLQAVRERAPEAAIILIAAHARIPGALELLREGATDYVARPFRSEELEARVRLAAERCAATVPLGALRRLDRGAQATLGLVGRSPAMERILRQLPAVARSEASVILYGESGSGKELLARTLHALSPRASAAFVAVSCGALPESLLENELFGHERGAYTDARDSQPGLVQAADGGTLFLDEVGEMSPATQVKLLRFLQEREYRPLGSTRTCHASVRVISATHRDLGRAIAEGAFREDLFYRLNIIPLQVPPLRERKEDIPLLVAHFLGRIASPTLGQLDAIAPAALARLTAYDWPGNVRELENKLQQVIALATSREIRAEQIDLPTRSSAPAPGTRRRSFKEAKREAVTAFEVGYITGLLAETDGNISEAARLARKHRRAFWEIMKKHGLCGKARPEPAAAEAPPELVGASS